MNKQSFSKILELHALWLNGNKEGVRADLRDVNLDGANLKGANLEGADLEGASIEGADLECANLMDSVLRGANLEGANLVGANLNGAYLRGANLLNTCVYTFYTGKHFGFLHENTIKIGCVSHDVNYWRKNIVKIGRINRYTDEQIRQTIKQIKLLLAIQKENRSE